MYIYTRSIVVLVFQIVSIDRVISLLNDSQAMQEFLFKYNREASSVIFDNAEASWNYNTNMTPYNMEIMNNETAKYWKFAYEASVNATIFDLSAAPEMVKRELLCIMNIGTAAQTNQTKASRLIQIQSDMATIYNTRKVFLNKTDNTTDYLLLNSDLGNLNDFDKMKTDWKDWRDATGKKMKHLYPEYVELMNEAHRILGYNDTGEYWRSWYETPTFIEDIELLWQQIRPLYEQLHAYARRKLKYIYGNDKFPPSGHIPAHILDRRWVLLEKELLPFPDKGIFDVTEEMVRQNYTVLKMFQMADEFFQSLGLIPMPHEFWNKSMFEQPTDNRSVVCHATSWDFHNSKDFRILMCADVNYRSLQTIHHEMGHIQYFLQYADKPISFRQGANPAFHEAVGELILLSVKTPEHMHSIGLLKTLNNDTEYDINFLMSMALKNIGLLPFAYLTDQWRWKVFRGDVSPDEYNKEWWNLKCRYQGFFPPVERTSEDFDPGYLFHIASNFPFVRYFLSYVIQFQLHKALCQEIGYTGPLHRCDIYNSTVAGRKISDMLKLGSSVHWREVMRNLTGQDKMLAEPLLEYFKPLTNYLKRVNCDDYGWNDQCPQYEF